VILYLLSVSLSLQYLAIWLDLFLSEDFASLSMIHSRSIHKVDFTSYDGRFSSDLQFHARLKGRRLRDVAALTDVGSSSQNGQSSEAETWLRSLKEAEPLVGTLRMNLQPVWCRLHFWKCGITM